MKSVDTQFLEELTFAIAECEDKFLSPIGPLIISAAALGIAEDSRRFSHIFDIEHALVIRECNALENDYSLICAERLGHKSQRISYTLSEKAIEIVNTVKGNNELSSG